MIFCRWLSIVVTILCSSVVVARAEKGAEGYYWKCNDMTPDLCDDLTFTKHTFVTRNKLKIRYWRYASPNLDKTKFPVIVINGGPGMPHDYDLPLRQLACRGREVIFYDQGGTGESALPPNTTVANDYPFLLDASYYANEELPALVKALDNLKYYHIVSDSWGTMIAMQSAIESPDPNLLSLTLNGPIPRANDYIDKAWDPVEGSIGTLPEYIKSRMLAIQASGDFESEEFQEIQAAVSANFYSRNGLFADCVVKSFMGRNEEINVGMWGAVDFFNITGTLKTFDLWSDIKALDSIPTLLTSGSFDMIRPSVVQELFQQLPLSEKVLFPHSGHMSIFDATGELLNTVNGFLDRVEHAETDEQIVFVPKRFGNEKEKADTGIPAFILQFAVAVVVLAITFIVGFVLGNSRGNQRSNYSEIA